ncbi:hypothetical protein CRP9_gp07 [Roseobacter phage CRP-9]|nr:hypothetical protein CRP9_gp07 [Roseobacter phage CRP-9]
MAYRINVAKREQIRMRYGKMEDSYRHYFKIVTEMMMSDVMQLVQEQKEKYPAPEYNVTLYRETSYSEQVNLEEMEEV